MDTNRIKKFAIEARNVLKAGVAAKLMTLGFRKDGSVSEDMMPTLLQGGCIWNGRTETEGFYHRWMSLYERVQRKGLNEVYEEVAYTWFNRFVAIRILRKNGLSEPVLDFVDAANTPRIVDQARSGQLPQMNEEDRIHILDLLDDDTRTTEQFALLMTAWCQNNPIISKCFGSIADYTEILLPNNILTEGGFIDMLNHTEFISDEDFTSPELIGWLYQFYISERKDEVFAKKGKFEADEIPAATQIFTPNWIVKYMVQNTVGRIYLDNNPYSTTLKANWEYFVEGEPTPLESIYRYEELTDLKVADLACGSGHILNECFDLLYELYIHEGYTRGEAIENIFKCNLTGVDLDKRAQQLSMFALLLKACQKDRSYADARCMPNVLTMPKAWDEEKLGTVERFVPHFFKGTETKKVLEELSAAYKLMNDADSLGSIMKFDLSDSTRKALSDAVAYWQKESFVPKDIQAQMPAMKLILALTEKYSALIANPPYMGRGHMTEILSKYLDRYYPNTKFDLFATFMQMMLDKTGDKGKTGFITMESWMFLSSYESFRNEIIENYYISSLGHFGWHIIGIAFGTVMSIIEKNKANGRKGEYSYLTIDDIDKSCNKPYIYPKKDNGRYAIVSQTRFTKIPGSPIGYWVSDKIRETFSSNRPLSAVCKPTQGLATADNGRFLRQWFEVALYRIGFNQNSAASAADSGKKWFPYNKGGAFRKWYGNQEHIVNWENDGFEIKNFKGSVIRNPLTYFNRSISWSKISAGNIAFRSYPYGFIYDVAGTSLFPYNEELYNYYIGVVNSNSIRHILKIISPTLNYEVGQIATLPIPDRNNSNIENSVEECITITKQDWDAHETSWDFKESELIRMKHHCGGNVADLDMLDKEEAEAILRGHEVGTNNRLIEHCYRCYVSEWTRNFHQLHANEEELNRQFIEIYGLQDELTPDVPLDEVTILQQGEIKIENNQIQFQRDVVIKQLISYAIGCWMGRYRLDKPGLHIAHPSPTADEVCTYSYGNEILTIDDDGNIPLLPYDCPFEDNLQNRIADFVRIAFGAESLAENLNFIEQSLGCTIEKYLDKDFWKDHKKMYSNRPIYWLWSSKKGAFRVLSYMHRMDAYTAERVRSRYLLPYIEFLQNKINELSNRGAGLSTADSRKLDNYRKILEECQEYHERLQVVAEQAIGFDLDDGVVVNYAKFGDVLSKIK